MLGGGPFDLPRGAWSDDTAMALCLAESLLERDGFDARDQVAALPPLAAARATSPPPSSASGSPPARPARWPRAQWRRQAFSGSHDPEALDPETLSRVAPAVLFYFADAAAGHRALGRGGPHHLPGAGGAGCLPGAGARAARGALRGAPKAAILAAAEALVGSTSRPAALGQEGSAAGRRWRRRWRSLRGQHNFRDAVLTAANLGGTSDVVAAACGRAGRCALQLQVPSPLCGATA